MTANRDLENEQQLLASFVRARTGDLGPGPATARKAASDTRCRSGSLIVAWRLCNSRPATIFSSGYTHLSCLYNSRRTIQFSCGITTNLGRPYNVGFAIPCSTGHAILYRRCNYIPESQCPESPCPESQCLGQWRYICNSATRPYEITYEITYELHTNYIRITYELHIQPRSVYVIRM